MQPPPFSGSGRTRPDPNGATHDGNTLTSNAFASSSSLTSGTFFNF